MAQYIYEISEETLDSLGDMAKDTVFPDAYYLVGLVPEECEDADKEKRKELLDSMSKYFDTGDASSDEESYLMISDAGKEKYFSGRYAEMKDKVNGMNLHDFSCGPKANFLDNIIEDRFGNYVWIEDCITTMDEFLRAAPPDKYYVGNIVQAG